MIIDKNIKKTMYMGAEISHVIYVEKREENYAFFTLWKKFVPPPPKPKPCESTCEKSCQNCQGKCETSCEKNCQSTCQKGCEKSTQCGNCEDYKEQCYNCMSDQTWAPAP